MNHTHPPNIDQLNILHINIRGIRANKEELIKTLQEKDVHIASINETFLAPDIRFSLPGYDIIRKDRPRAAGPQGHTNRRGGVALLIKRTITYNETLIPVDPNQTQGNEYISAKVKLSPTHNLLMVSIYCPPSTTPSAHLFQEIISLEKTVAIMGDFNAKHFTFYNQVTNQSGEALNDIIEQTNLVLLNNDEPTHYSATHDSVDILDLCLCSPDLAGKLNTFTVCGDLGSDHLPILASFSLRAQSETRPPQYDYKKADWEAFRHHITNHSASLPPCEPDPPSIEFRVKQLSEILLTARESTMQLRKPPKGPNELPPHILQLIQQKRRWRRKFMKTRCPIDKHRANQLQTQVKIALKKERENTWDKIYSDLNKDAKLNPKAFWQRIHQLNGKKRSSKITALKHNGLIVEEDMDKANVFKEHLEDVHSSPEDPLFDPEWKTIVERQVNLPTHIVPDTTQPNHPLTQPPTLIELQQHIKKLKVKAPGEDTIDNRLIKEAPPEYLALLADLYTCCLNTGYFPKAWKTALVTMIPKPDKDPHIPANYRPISLLSCLGKLLERVIADRLQTHFESIGSIGVHQAGFRKNRSTTDNILRLAEDVQRNFNKKLLTAAVFFDVEKAFDKMWHQGLMYRLIDKNLQLPRATVVLINSFLSQREIAVRVGAAISSRFTPEAGVPQGSGLSPILFLKSIADIYYPPPQEGEVSQFADDLGYWTSSMNYNHAQKKLQRSITEIENWANMWRVKLNPLKTQVVLFSGKTQPQNLILKLYGQTLTASPTAKFLGVTFQRNMKWTVHIANIEKEARKRLNHLRIICRRNGGATPETAIRVYIAYIRSLFEYAIPAWCNLSKYQLQKFQIVQNIAIRMCYRLPSYTNVNYIHKLSGLKTLKERLAVLGKKYLNRAESNPSLQRIIAQERTGPPRHICSTPLSVLITL